MSSLDLNGQTRKVGFISLGCPKALRDSELILTRLRAEGYAVVPTYQEDAEGNRKRPASSPSCPMTA